MKNLVPRNLYLDVDNEYALTYSDIKELYQYHLNAGNIYITEYPTIESYIDDWVVLNYYQVITNNVIIYKGDSDGELYCCVRDGNEFYCKQIN